MVNLLKNNNLKMKNTILILVLLLTIIVKSQTDAQYKCMQNANTLKFYEGFAISVGTNACVLTATKKPHIAVISSLIASCVAGTVIKLSGRANNYQCGLVSFGGLTGTVCFGIGKIAHKSYLLDKGRYQFK